MCEDEKTLYCIQDIISLISELDRKTYGGDKNVWVFRGVSSHKYPLLSSYDRFWESFLKEFGYSSIPKNSNPGNLSKYDKRLFEQLLLDKYVRESSEYLDCRPKPTDRLEWAALMQHYGAPSRLLDWSYSFLVSLFFAVSGSSYKETDNMHRSGGCDACDCAVYALNGKKIRELAKSRFGREFELESISDHRDYKKYKAVMNHIFQCNKKGLVFPVIPSTLNDRLIRQQGLFLIQGDVGITFKENIDMLIDHNDRKDILIKYRIPIELKSDILRHLQRMNITSTTLYSGMEGFSQSFTNFNALYPMLMI